MATKVSGKGTYISFNGIEMWVAGGQGFSVEHKLNTAESTAGADVYENSVPTTRMIKADLDAVMIADADGGTDYRAAMALGTESALLYGWEGNGAGKPKGGFTGRVVDASVTVKHDDVIKIKVAWENAGDDLLFDDTIHTW